MTYCPKCKGMWVSSRLCHGCEYNNPSSIRYRCVLENTDWATLKRAQEKEEDYDRRLHRYLVENDMHCCYYCSKPRPNTRGPCPRCGMYSG